MSGLFGGRPIAVLLQLVIVSVIVGIILAAFQLNPMDIFRILEDIASRIYAMGFDAIEWGLQYFLLGATIVVPIWLISRLFRAGSGKKEK